MDSLMMDAELRCRMGLGDLIAHHDSSSYCLFLAAE